MKKNSQYFSIFLSIMICSLVLGCNFNRESVDSNPPPTPPEPEICQKLNWNQVKDGLKGYPELFGQLENIYSYISACAIKKKQADDLIFIYKLLKNRVEKEQLLLAINTNEKLIKNNKKILNFYQNELKKEKDIFIFRVMVKGLSDAGKTDNIIDIYKGIKNDRLRKIILLLLPKHIDSEDNSKVLQLYLNAAVSDNRTLAPIALRGLTNSPSDERWTTWSWEPQLSKILEKSVEIDFYKLSHLQYVELLVLTRKYPDSKFTKACIEYRNFTEGEYFGQSVGVWGSNNQATFRQPFFPERELKFWPEFLKKYPEHPSADDATYRVARSYEMKGDYETAILWYYQVSQTPDGSMSYFARDRILFIIDLLMSSNSLTKFLQNHPTHPLVPQIEYSKAIHLIREKQFQVAKLELKDFIKKYQNSKLSIFFNGFNSWYLWRDEEVFYPLKEGLFYDSDHSFWKKINKQIKDVENIIKIREKEETAQSLYEEASFWFHNDFITYNHFWNGGLWNMLSGVIPGKWEGVVTSTRRSITYELVQAANQGYKLQLRHFKSIVLFEKLLKDYPKSKFAERAKYSIGLNYYYLWHGNYPDFFEQEFSWEELALKSYKDFVTKFPNSSMADDALIVIASLESEAEAVQALEKIMNNYPDGDRYEQAKERLNHLRNQNRIEAPPPQQPASPIVGVGIRMQNIETGNGVLIQELIPNLPASQAGLQSGDIILSVDGQSVTNIDDVARLVRQHQAGDIVRFEIERQGQKFVVDVVTALISL